MNENKCELKILFDTEEQLQAFISFMSCFGEQTYYEWMEERIENRVKFKYEKRHQNIILTESK